MNSGYSDCYQIKLLPIKTCKGTAIMLLLLSKRCTLCNFNFIFHSCINIKRLKLMKLKRDISFYTIAQQLTQLIRFCKSPPNIYVVKDSIFVLFASSEGNQFQAQYLISSSTYCLTQSNFNHTIFLSNSLSRSHYFQAIIKS